MQNYTVKIYEADVEKYSTEITTEDIHESLWDIISDIVSVEHTHATP